MWQDPIVKETREMREQYASTLNHDVDAIFQDIKKRQEKSGRQQVTFPARKSRQNSVSVWQDGK